MSKSEHLRRWTLESRKPAFFSFPTDRELGVPLGTPLKKAFKRIKERDHDIPMP